jgi:arylsulfatase A-like enzyme/Flp pilus assembly protein TadD
MVLRLQYGLLVSLLAVTTVLAKDRPNVVLVTIDTIRADRIGCYGYPKAETPNLDWLAHEGIRFGRAFSPVPLTLPAHASILTGTYPGYHGVRDNSGFTLSPQHPTLARLLKALGYSTGAFVGAYVLDSKFGLGRGFDHYYDHFDLDRYQNMSPGYIRRSGDVVVGEAIRWLGHQNGAPFFVWVHLYDAHDPYLPPEPFATRHAGRSYDGAVAFADSNVGVLLRWLKKTGAYRNTLIVVVGDHGESLGEHGEKTHGFFIYNSVLHVPLIIRLPNSKSAGLAVPENVTTVDVAPTIAELVGLPRSEWPNFQGTSLFGLILRKKEAARQIYAESYYPRLQFGWSELRALISGKNKYILAPKPELYDLPQDTAEADNVIAQRPAVASEMRTILNAMTSRISISPGPARAQSSIAGEDREKLHALGYIADSMGNAGSHDFLDLPDPKDELGTYDKILDLAERNSRGDYSSTIAGYQSILEAHPQLPLAHYKLGQAYSQTENYPAAMEQFKMALALSLDAVGPSFELALTYQRLGRTDDAVLGFRRTLQLDPSHYEARVNLGVLLTGSNKLPEAIDELQKAAALAPRSPSALSALGIAYSLNGENDRGVEAMKRALQLSPSDAFLHANLGAIYKRMGRSAEAEEQFALARQLRPGFFRNQ